MLIDETKGETVNPSYNFAKAATERVQKLGLKIGHGVSYEIGPLPTVMILPLFFPR